MIFHNFIDYHDPIIIISPSLETTNRLGNP